MPRFFEKQHHQDSTSSENPQKEFHQPDLEQFHPKISEAGEIETILTWQAPSRPFRKRDRSYYTTIAVLVILLILIAFLAREFLLIGVLMALTFVTYVLAFVPPHDIAYKLTTQGVTIGDHFYFWHSLDSFWFKQKEGHEVLFIQTRLNFPGQLMMVVNKGEEDSIKKNIAKFLPFREIPHSTFLDKWAESMQKHFPLENTHGGCSSC